MAVDPIEHLGRDIAFDFDADNLLIGNENDFAVATPRNNIKQAIIARLRTREGELLNHSDYGCGLTTLIGKNPNDLTPSLAVLFTRKALLQEPRIASINNISADFRPGTNRQQIDISIDITVIETFEELNLIFALFVTEGGTLTAA